MTRTSLALVLPAALALSALAAGGQQAGVADNGTRFNWNGAMPAGSWLVVRNMNGPVSVKAATGRTADVSGIKRAENGGDLGYVRFVTKPLANGGMLVCALWGDNSNCDEDGYHSNNNNNERRRNNVEVEFTVSVPSGVNVRIGSVNGDIEVAGATAEVEASSVNGDVRAVSSGGPVSAKTVNGDVRVSMRALGTGDLRYDTVNGSIQLDLPASLNADVELRTVNGGFETDFPMTLSGRVSPRHLSGKIGTGGRELRATTVNGSITLRKSS
jgi:putative adhesin